jgi:hypothetical protein
MYSNIDSNQSIYHVDGPEFTRLFACCVCSKVKGSESGNEAPKPPMDPIDITPRFQEAASSFSNPTSFFQKCRFQGRAVDVHSSGRVPTRLGIMTFGCQWWQGGEKKSAESDCTASDICVYSWGYRYRCQMRPMSGKELLLPSTFKVTYVNKSEEASLDFLKAWCQNVSSGEGSIALDTEGNGSPEEPGCATFQIASDKLGEVLVIHLGAFRSESKCLDPKGPLACVHSLLEGTPCRRSFVDYGDHGSTDPGKVYGAFGGRINYAPKQRGSGLKKMASDLGFGFELKRTGEECHKRGFKGKNEKAKPQQQSIIVHEWKVPECGVDIHFKMWGNLCPTVSQWEQRKCHILTLEQCTYAALDAWIQLWYCLLK